MIWIGDAVHWEAADKSLQDPLIHEVRIAAQRTGGVTVGC
jgi:hypothetical protein